MWHEEMKLLIHTCAGKRKLVHRPLPVRKIGSRNMSTGRNYLSFMQLALFFQRFLFAMNPSQTIHQKRGTQQIHPAETGDGIE